MSARLILRRMAGQQVGAAALLDAVETRGPGGVPLLKLFFAHGTDPQAVGTPKGLQLEGVRSIGSAPCLTYSGYPGGPVRLALAGQTLVVTPVPAGTDALAGANAAAAVRNGESAAAVMDWLRYHCTCHGMTGAVILDRAAPGTDPDFSRDLAAALDGADLACDVVLLDSDLPLGKPGLPAEAHPWCVPGAPGKDRMTVPPASPWDSPLGALMWYEIARVRFLEAARAVMNIDVHDLLIPAPGGTVFDRAVAAQGGLIRLIGQHCYPWRVRDEDPIRFADHICVQFDATGGRPRWCIAPAKAPRDAVWRLVRVGNAAPDPQARAEFYRCMALRHPVRAVSKIVPKTSLVEHPPLLDLAQERWAHKPVRMPEATIAPTVTSGTSGRGRRAIVTTMKNEGPFILEWLAHHRAIGFDDILVYTNDCSDGTDALLDLLQDRGLVRHRDNPFRQSGLKPQHAALQAAEDEPVIRDADWITCIDVDEFINIKAGDGTLDALFAAVPGANMVAMTWRLFGNGDVDGFRDTFVTEQFLQCAPEYARKPHQAWGFKTLFRNIGLFKKLGVHRPKGLNPQLWEQINWVNGSGRAMPRGMFRNGWRSTVATYGYDLVQLNHYAVRSAESFLVKRDRGRVNHVDRDQGLAYWFRMNNNAVEDRSILPRLAAARAELERLVADPAIAAAHADCVARHRAKIAALKATPSYAAFHADLVGRRLRKLSRLHAHFGANVFLAGPGVIPDAVADQPPGEDWFFTVDEVDETAH